MIKIEKLDHQGRGIGKINNKIIFIPYTLPDEIVEFKITKEKKNYLEGQAIKIIKPSEIRITPPCPYYTKCGGCNLMHLNYNEQLKYKQEKIENIISKYTNKDIKINKIIKAEHQYYYRNKITLHAEDEIGFYKNNSKNIIKINKCIIADKSINNIIKELNDKKIKNNELIIRTNNKETLLYIKNNNENLKSIKADNIINNSKIIKGNNYIIENINNYKYLVSPTSFFQVNTEQTIKLYNKIKELAKITKNDKILDLYCGTGTIGLYLSKACKEVLGVEINKEAIKDANKNKIINNIKNATFIAGDAKEIIKKLKFNPDIIIIDPPRSGLFKGMINNLIKFKAKKIIYVSCDPITLARDLKELSNLYNIEEIQPLDMFPNTYHVECVTLLSKK